MSKHFNELTPAEAERLALLAEECAEAIAIIGKVLRHGYESRNPDDVAAVGNAAPTNRQLLEQELGDIEYARTLMVHKGDVNEHRMAKHWRRACDKKPRYLHHQGEPAIAC